MNRWHGAILAVVAAAAVAGRAPIVDDFSEGGWERFDSTPGMFSAQAGELHLVDGAEAPAWVTVSKTFSIDVDATPVFLVKVVKVSDRGTVKLIRQHPHDKRVAIQIDRPGLYAVDMKETFGWSGRCDIQTCLYAIGDEEEITYEYVTYAEHLTTEDQALLDERESGGNITLDVGSFEVVPLFNACSYYIRGPRRPGLCVVYRRTGAGPWFPAYPPVYVEADRMYRGSIVYLEEDTPYQLRVLDRHGDTVATTDFRTWSSEVPIARTIVLDEQSFDGSLSIREEGTPEGWIKITAPEGFVLSNDRAGPLIELYKAKYVLVEGLTLRGGLKEAITIRKCDHIRIVNCDIAGWGRMGTQRFDRDGKFYTDEGHAINWDSAILLSKSTATVIERCYIHDPVNTANSWYYSHPAGPQAVGIDKPRSTVIRYNDFIGSDHHRWNDAMEGAGNFHIDGGFNRDADIYGNMVTFANDDAVEIDGGQTNVRVFLNKFEGCLCGVSIQGCMSGPSYVFHNLLVNMGDERGKAGQTIKTSSYANGPGAVSFIFGNTCHGDSGDLNLVPNLRIVAKNNIFAGRRAIAGRRRSPQSECDYNLLSTGEPANEPNGVLAPPGFIDPEAGLFLLRTDSPAVKGGVALPNIAAGGEEGVDMGAIPAGSGRVLPQRPIPVYLDRYQLTLSPGDVRTRRTPTVTAQVRGTDFSSLYRIAQNDAFDWFTVTPQAGVLASGGAVSFTITVIPERMQERRHYRGAFLVRLANGFSRPVMVYADTDVTPPAKPMTEIGWTTYLEAEEAGNDNAYEIVSDEHASAGKCLKLAGPQKENPVSYRFSVPEDGVYFMVLRAKSPEPLNSHDSLFFRLDEGPLDRAQLRTAATWAWSLAAHNRRQGLSCLQPFTLSAGEHVLQLAPREGLLLDLVAVTDSPAAFE